MSRSMMIIIIDGGRAERARFLLGSSNAVHEIRSDRPNGLSDDPRHRNSPLLPAPAPSQALRTTRLCHRKRRTDPSLYQEKLMRMIQATQFTGYQGLVQLDAPKPQVADGRVLVRVTAAGVTPLDHTILSGGHPRAKAPLVLGNEGAGVIEDAGASGLVPGSRVAFTGGYGVAENGSWEDYVAVRTDDLLPVPDGIDDVLAASLPVAYLTAQIALDDAGFAPGKTVFTPAIGGSVGNATYQLAKARGAAATISQAGSTVKATQARDRGYTDIIDLSAENIRDGVRRTTGGKGAD